MKYSIVIPCYNESESLQDLLDALTSFPRKYDVEFILVENGSTDGSRAMFLRMPEFDGKRIRSVFVDHNQGYGYGILQGLAAASGDYVGWIHADLQVAIDELTAFFDIAEAAGPNQRYFIKGLRKNRSAYERIFTIGMGICESILFRKHLYDVGGFPVVFHRSLLSSTQDAPYDFLFDTYMYYMAACSDLEIVRPPVKMIRRLHGRSSWNRGLSDHLKTSVLFLKRGFSISRQIRQKRRNQR